MSARLLPVRPWITGGHAPRGAFERTAHPLCALSALLRPAAPARLPGAVARALAAAREPFARLDAGGFDAAVTLTGSRLRRDGLTGQITGEALALAAVALERTLGLSPYPAQLQAAWLLLDGRFAEMATGEGKTLAVALGAAVAALAGSPVHVITANDYLVARDRANLQAFYGRLGLGCAAVLSSTTRAERAAAYGHDVVYVTARELAFDYLNDHLRLRGERDPLVLRARALQAGEGDSPATVLPDLCCAMIDEADSILLDEACVPFILSAPGAAPEPSQPMRAIRSRLCASVRFVPASIASLRTG